MRQTIGDTLSDVAAYALADPKAIGDVEVEALLNTLAKTLAEAKLHTWRHAR